MLTTEYFYGIEIFRGVLLFYVLKKRTPERKFLDTLWQMVKSWWPFGVLSLSMVFWRAKVGVTEGATYSVGVPQAFDQGVLIGLWEFIQKIFFGIYSATAEVIFRAFKFPSADTFGPIKTAAFYLLLAGTLVVSWWVFSQFIGKNSSADIRFDLELVVLGVIGLGLGGLPFWAAGLQYFPIFPSDRLGLSMMMGWSLLIVGLLLLTQGSRICTPLFSVLFSLGLAANFLLGAAYVQSWEDQQTFWRQFVTRVPALEPGTVVVTSELETEFMNDLSFMMTLNWLYDLEPTEDYLNYGMFYFDSRGIFQTIEEDMSIVYDRRMVNFESDINNILLISYSKSGCLYIFDQIDGYDNPHSRLVNEVLIEFSNPDLIDLDVDQFENWPGFFEPIAVTNWCYYFQRGSLELQRENYAEVARLGDLAFEVGEKPNYSWERAPFIEGYGFMERWQDAIELTTQAMSFSFTAEELLCNIWGRIDAGTPDSESKQNAFAQVSEIIACQFE
jgi:hypothetical protein